MEDFHMQFSHPITAGIACAAYDENDYITVDGAADVHNAHSRCQC
jgi:hypothetical protein